MNLIQILIYVAVFLVSVSIDLSVFFKFKSSLSSKTKKLELAKIVKLIPDFVRDAEHYIGSGNGFAKLNYVLNKLHILCIEKGLDFDEDAFTYEVENVLSTPTKKEALDEA